jgi:gas vesicle protein
MSDDSSSGASGIILSFLLGGLTGAALAILFAPRSGKETRDLLQDKFREGTERGVEFRDRVVKKGREVLDDASEYVGRQKETLDRRRERLAAAVEAGRQAYREEKDKDKDKM